MNCIILYNFNVHKASFLQEKYSNNSLDYNAFQNFSITTIMAPTPGNPREVDYMDFISWEQLLKGVQIP